MVVTAHDAGTFHAQFAHVALFDGVVLLVDDFTFPSEPRYAYRADFMNVFQSQMHATRTGGFREAVVGIVLMVREILHPALNEGRRHGLGADVHKPPLRKLVVLNAQFAPVERRQQVLTPRHQ